MNLIGKSWENQLHDFFHAYCVEQQGVYYCCSGGTEDHVHLVVQVEPTLLVSEFVGKIKGASSFEFNKRFGRKALLWQRGYGVVSFAKRDLPGVRDYVANQKEHHAQGSTRAILEIGNACVEPDDAIAEAFYKRAKACLNWSATMFHQLKLVANKSTVVVYDWLKLANLKSSWKIRSNALLLAAGVLFVFASQSSASVFQAGDVLIRNGNVIDGTGAPARDADVLVRGDRIAAIGKFAGETTSGVTVINAAGRIVAPGFIDTHAHGDPAETPEMHNYLAMGVTTICLGQDGSSTRVQGMKQWFNDITTTKPGPNVLTFVGHGTVRTESGVRLSTEPTTLQLQQMADLVEQALELGAFGLTTGLEYQPGAFSKPDELAIVAKPVGARGLTIMSHMRNEDDDQLSSSIRELVEQCRSAGAHAHISHLKSVYGKGTARAEEILTLLEELRQSGVSVTADIYPYTASHTGLSILFPPWALPPNSYDETTRTRRAELVAYLHDRVAKRNGPGAMLLSTKPHAGKTLAQVAAELNKPYAEVLADMGPKRGSAAYFVMDEELQSRLLVAPGVNICTDGSPDMRHPRGYGSFARVIRKYVNEDRALTIEQAVHKMSGLPAQTITLDKRGRGTLRPGNYADILVFDPAQVRDLATFDQPFELAEGFNTILINGTIIRDAGKFTGQRTGRVIKRDFLEDRIPARKAQSRLAKPEWNAASGAPRPDENGFVSLFNGKDLSGWTGATTSHTVQNGVIVCPHETHGNLFTEKEFSDFHFKFEYKLTPGANNGVGIRSPLEGTPAFDAIEIQILDDAHEKWRHLQSWQLNGGIYGVAAAKPGFEKPVGEWNAEEIVAQGKRIKVILNGEQILDVNLDDVTSTATVDAQPHPGLKRVRGHIGFLGHGDRVEFRNISISDFAPEPPSSKRE
ncbi:MAG: family 16 glycoside hydrolase [Candidatus Sumerlaeaceae bacterium]